MKNLRRTFTLIIAFALSFTMLASAQCKTIVFSNIGECGLSDICSKIPTQSLPQYIARLCNVKSIKIQSLPSIITPNSSTQTVSTATPVPTAAPTAAPTTAPTAVPIVTPSSGNASYVQQVIELVNAEREKHGLAPLTENATVSDAAQTRAKETVRSFSHTRPNGESCFTVLKEYGVSYRTCGENIAMGQKTPEQVVNAWMNSEGHRKNILNSSFKQIGVGCYVANGTYYWSQLFIG